MGEHYRIRAADVADLPAIAAMERKVFSDPWSPESLRLMLGHTALVADSPSGVAGYLFSRSAWEEGEILNLAVHEDHRRQGIGRRLVRKALTLLAAQGARTVFLEVRESNLAARAFYERLGFKERGRRRHYYRRPREDALVLARPVEPKKVPACEGPD
ncbi:MAG: ribosomal protein S18-alanine N-acetyltransferase [Gemmatimonadales bacterium]|nr:ribosomal protein S18-alanine N-acetyltransferase [Gemmatimonadales bacterium]NIN09855.1 ribosomal protein S18-alanine N-acetyltransferase [Gemmatimonadales bacterium]NIN48559.1 ribosomal protein S18-alanine N-acetyltransferase [Gemmatimonadales bacterium]NIP06023.1 ribosomal protein S18-alanine N-acetyltransferase [Gemmatimonadales bacterium]NIR01169.1 ribosomal protein S18-alanine N-acetyltransferase [Gemmatimonadales bacterium]